MSAAPQQGLIATRASLASWSEQQHCFRQLLKGIRGAYFHDRSKLFWARHRVRLEFYKYSSVSNEEDVKLLVGVAREVARFIDEHLQTSVQRIVQHNEKILSLSAADAKRYRQEYLLAEQQHDSWCRQKIKTILNRRPPPPYPFC
jgi:hypothetical protein